jgi:hypothetical protein
MEKKFYYTCAEDSQLGKALKQILTQCNEANIAADAWAKKHHAVAYVDSGIHMAGGVALLEFEKEPLPSLWKRAEDFIEGKLYEPNVPDDLDLRELRQRQKEGKPMTDAERLELERLELPTVDGATLLGALGAEVGDTRGTDTLPAFFIDKGQWWIGASYPCTNPDLKVTTENTYTHHLTSAT